MKMNENDAHADIISDFTHEQTDYSFVGVGFLTILCDMLSHGARRNFVQKILESHPRQMKTFPANLDDPMLFTEYHPSS